ncbi:16S rRNA (uracil(1498)-N(3))-methyltransferase [Thalassotalea aquiviva]|uniref:16S rRNA (uracil(1498)-N(3))-methyltransferase n=1 Tax=Thalassotalea aquiviva TaxID=3242415 RepID=UPI00352B080F
MSNPRIYQASEFTRDSLVTLSDDAFGHVVRVLRLKPGDHITLFNGDGCDYQARLVDVEKKRATAEITDINKVENESPLDIHLGQGISRGDRMDFTLQKSVELGVNTITPLFTERCGVKLNAERLDKKRQQWQKIVIAACEQSGRAKVPQVLAPLSLQEWTQQQTEALKINLHPRAKTSIMGLAQVTQKVRLLIGPEGGLTVEEIEQASDAGFVEVLMGPRVLRTETAALTAITALQCKFGDLV